MSSILFTLRRQKETFELLMSFKQFPISLLGLYYFLALLISYIIVSKKSNVFDNYVFILSKCNNKYRILTISEMFLLQNVLFLIRVQSVKIIMPPFSSST